jgi:hypothetical protein
MGPAGSGAFFLTLSDDGLGLFLGLSKDLAGRRQLLYGGPLEPLPHFLQTSPSSAAVCLDEPGCLPRKTPKRISNIEQGISNVEGNKLPEMINHPSLPIQQSR